MPDQPFRIFAVNDVNVGPFTQSADSVFFAANNSLHPQPGKMPPLGQFRDPCVTGNTQRGDDQRPVHLKAVIHEMLDGCQRDDRLAQAAVQKQSALGMQLQELNAKLLVVMKTALIQSGRAVGSWDQFRICFAHGYLLDAAAPVVQQKSHGGSHL